MINYITGANGFVGSHLARALDDVICIPHADIIKTKLEPFDSLYFLSAYGNMYSHTDDRKIIQANVGDLIHLLLGARNCGFKSFVYVSSSSVELPIQTMYSRTKKVAEEILQAFIDKHDLPICIVRPFSITGVGEQKEHLIPTLIRSCFTGEQVNFVPDPRHDFIDVKDVVSGILQLSNAGAKGIFRLGNSFSVSNKEVLRLVEEAADRKANIKIVGNVRSYDNEDWYSKDYISQKYGWTQRISLADSIRAMVADYAK